MMQGSPEWHAARLGKVTASRVADVIARTKTGWGASRANYAAELLVERLTGVPTEKFTSDAMRFGTENEGHARAAYEFRTDASVALAGFVDHPTLAFAGASPDGLVESDGLLEIKVPNTATHIDTLLGRSVPARYVAQIQWQLSCTGRAWCDFVSFDPRLPEHLRFFVHRVDRDEAMIADLEREVRTFLSEIDATIARLSSLTETAGRPIPTQPAPAASAGEAASPPSPAHHEQNVGAPEGAKTGGASARDGMRGAPQILKGAGG